MDPDRLIQQLAHDGERIRLLAHGVSNEQARRRPEPDAWSILEVVNHLYDEERADFRPRLDVILHRPDDEFTPIDPQAWVSARNYNARDLDDSLANFIAEREQSLDWLRGLVSPQWDREYEAPFGTIRAGDIFASWVAHDLLHMRQLVELHRAHTLRLAGPYQVAYAGEW